MMKFISQQTLMNSLKDIPMYQGFNKPNNGEAFDELVNKTKDRYDKMRRKINYV